MNIAPTPWQIGRTISRAVYAADETPICICDSMGEATAAQEANHARLIAAAPDLLDALTNLYLVAREQLDQSATHDGLTNCDWLAAARAAINKATAHQ
jgi:hypothetical protein